MKTLFKNISLVSHEGITVTDVLFDNEKVEKIGLNISASGNVKEIDGEGKFLLPGMIDDQVHFRDPGFSHKADIASESFAAAAGGITTFMDMPNTNPATLTLDLLEEKYDLAAHKSLINYSFFMGINNENLEEALKVDNSKIPGITDDGLYFSDEKGILANYPDYLDVLFSRTETLVALHCENDEIIHDNFQKFKAKYGNDIPFRFHPEIRSEEACYKATEKVVEIAKKHNTRLHIYHVSTAAELDLFSNETNIRDKRITAEACAHHLHFTAEDYDEWGPLIKWNPAVKAKHNKAGLIEGLRNGKIDFIATDHAPHGLNEKMGDYTKSMSGGPLVQHALLSVLELYHQGKLTLPEIVKLTSANVAEAYRVTERGYLKEGQFADAVMIDLSDNYKVTATNILYKCGWSPFLGYDFKSRILGTWVNGQNVYSSKNEFEIQGKNSKRLMFEKDRS